MSDKAKLVINGVLLALTGSQSIYCVSAESDAMDQCLLDRLRSVDESTTVAMLTRACEAAVDTPLVIEGIEPGGPRQSVVSIRREADIDAREGRFVVSTHRPNYFIATYNDSPNVAPFAAPEGAFDEEEIKFQVSFKMPIATELFAGDTDLLFGYTAVSWWQVFNDDADNPFRETNYEPEIYFHTFTDASALGLEFTDWVIGVNHQSNGQSGSLSRGWDRLIASTAAEISDDLVLGIRAWHILHHQDRNSDISDYMGYGELGVGWVPDRNTFTLMYRPAAEGDALQLTWSYPISRYLRVYAQYWNGYGESLIDYDTRIERFGIGLALSDIISRD